MTPLGKKELLAWASETSGIRPCSKYADLRDGVVLLALASRLFPAGVEPRTLRRGPDDVERNWDALRCLMAQHRLPLHLCDRHAVAAGHARHCFNMLVLFYFLTKLARDSDFCVDFANPIDPGIAEFLQSPKSLICVGKVPAGEAGTNSELAPDETTTAATSSSGLPCEQEHQQQQQQHQQQQHQQQQKPLTSLPPAPMQRAASLASSLPMGGDELELQSLRARNARLEEELEHVRATSQLMLAQQRGLVASEVARTAEQFEVQMALLRLERDHEVRQCLIDVREEYDNFLRAMEGDSASSSAVVRALECKVQVLERELAETRGTALQLQNGLTTQRDRHDALAQRIQAICAAAPAAAPDDREVVAAITVLLEGQPQTVRDAVALRLKALMSQMQGLRCEAERLRGREERDSAGGGGVGEVCRLRVQLERLKQTNHFLHHQRRQQQQQQHQQLQQHDWYAVPLADALEAPSCTIDSETCDAICARVSAVVEAHTLADSAVRKEVQRLVDTVQILQARVQTASAALIAYRDKQQGLYEQLLCAQQNSELEAHERQRTVEAKLDEQRLRMEASEAALTTKLRLAEERCSRRESAMKMLHERVRDMVCSVLKQSSSSNGNGNGGVALAEVRDTLQSIMAEVTGSQRTHESLEAALTELSEETANLRHQIALRGREVERLQSALAEAEAARRTGQAQVARVKAEVATLRDAIAVEVDACRRYIGRVGELLLTAEELPQPSAVVASRTATAAASVSSFPLTEVYRNGSRSTTTTTTTTTSIGSNSIGGREEAMEEEHADGVVEAEATSRTTTATTTSNIKAPAGAAVANLTPSLLSPEELERRKMAILSKYGFSSRLDH
ncbi:hypothetical protein DQ04_09211020 [Trypanosoma grayi]|uniref:hypothetical protein n=1 Tax=Trypanosoma grayi TaxID=71804 RepID=UPI0004F4AF98|nr:hypothetical protein DQ04_09211020 [Trypanosoma grayi]KEG07639.1 hypothetical protein DQ04_09211020 [Trypanosoma grayi]